MTRLEELCFRSMSDTSLTETKKRLTTELNLVDSEICRREGEKIFAGEPAFAPIGEVAFEFVSDAFCEICGDTATCGARCSACCAGCLSDDGVHHEAAGGEA
jgi:hypothetical protein